MSRVKTKAQAARPTKPSLDWLLDNGMPVYVLNRTIPRGIVVITFSDQKGRGAKFELPKTHLPVPISDAIPTDMLRTSVDFRNFVTKGVIEILWPETAREQLTPELEEEMRSACAEASNPNRYGYSARDNDDREQGGVERQGNAFVITEPAAPPPHHGRVIFLCNEFAQGAMEGRRVMRELQAIQAELGSHDFAYIVGNITGSGEWAQRIRGWAESKGGAPTKTRKRDLGAIQANAETGTQVIE